MIGEDVGSGIYQANMQVFLVVHQLQAKRMFMLSPTFSDQSFDPVSVSCFFVFAFRYTYQQPEWRCVGFAMASDHFERIFKKTFIRLKKPCNIGG